MTLDCTYHGEYSTPQNWYGACAANAAVPEGCPIRFVTPHAGAPLVIYRNGVELTSATSSSVIEATVGADVRSVDVYDCECVHISVPVQFDRIALTVPAAVAGDSIAFGGAGNAEESSIAITAAGPCPVAEWPTSFEQLTACDLCPMDPADPGHTPDGNGGCSTTGGGAGLVMLCLAVLAARRLSRT